MKHLIRQLNMLVVVTAFMIVPFTAAAQGVSTTAHDFSGDAWNTSGEICIVCHTPHDAGATADAPLWNHTTTTATFNTYDSATMNATPGAPSGVSLMCLSCHDGTVAIDSFGTSPTTTISVTGVFNKGTDLSNDHPISMIYDVADTGLNPVTDPSGTVAGGDIDTDLLFGGNVECASCHDPHDDAGVSNFLVKSNAASDLCLTCHAK
jgi:predicted CXXCH cytochrome family protein